MSVLREEVVIKFRESEHHGITEWFVRKAARLMQGEKTDDGWTIIYSRLLDSRTILLNIEKEGEEGEEDARPNDPRRSS